MSGHPPPSGGAGPIGGMGMPPQQGGPQHGNSGPPPGQSMSQQNLNQIVLEYLTKKGYTQTEQVLRKESAHTDKDGRPIYQRYEDEGPQKYGKSLAFIKAWIDSNLDIYKTDLSRLLWPTFIYSYFELIMSSDQEPARKFIQAFSGDFEAAHSDELQVLDTIKLPQHVTQNHMAKTYRSNKYRLPLNTNAYYNLVVYLESNATTGGTVILNILQTYCQVFETRRNLIEEYKFEAIVNRVSGHDVDEPGTMPEGIEGVFTGVTNLDMVNNSAPIKLGPLQTDEGTKEDIRAELAEEDARNPPKPGQESLLEQFEQKIKREESPDAITRAETCIPPAVARDVAMEVQKMKENRDRFRIDSRTGGIGPGVSVCMFTFHNTLGTFTCIEWSDDQQLIAVGTMESYIRVWNMDGEALSSIRKEDIEAQPTNSRRLIGHSARITAMSFSPSIAKPKTTGKVPNTASRLLLSSSEDGTIRLWSLEAWCNLIVYKGHEGPVWDVKWGPYGHYFASCGRDRTARIWVQDKITDRRFLVGHDSSCSQIVWHSNGAYLFSASDEHDKSIRMWSAPTGKTVRIFTGHTHYIGVLACSPNGKILASADVGGTIILWDIQKGTLTKRCRGHNSGGIWGLSFSAESTVLVSGGGDGTVRIWDVNLPADPFKNMDGEVIAKAGQTDATRINGSAPNQPTPNVGAGPSGGGKKKGKENVITPDQISAFPTKKTPVLNTKFTRMNLVVAAGYYEG